jgi:hypothetical protein
MRWGGAPRETVPLGKIETSTRPARLSRFECATGGCALPNSESDSVTRVESDDQSRRCECRTRAFAYTSRGLADNWSTAPSSESVPRLVFLSASPTVSLPSPFHSLLSLGHRGSRDEGNAAPWVSGESQIPRAPRPPSSNQGPKGDLLAELAVILAYWAGNRRERMR